MKTIENELYIFREDGTIFSKRYKRDLKQRPGNSGYLLVGQIIDGTKCTKTVHSVIANAFIPKEEGMNQINHIDGDKLNNDLSNLERCTMSQNIIHGFRSGLIPMKISLQDLIDFEESKLSSRKFAKDKSYSYRALLEARKQYRLKKGVLYDS